MYRDAKIADYIADAASAKPAPGGGSVSALVAALGTTMASMTANFTVGRKKFAAVEPRAKEILARLESLRGSLLDLVDEDVAAYTILAAAYALPKETDAQKSVRQVEIQRALSVATGVPLHIMEASLAALESVAELVEIANPNLLSDAGVSAVVLDAALRAAQLNVEVNLNTLADPDFVARTRDHAHSLVTRAKSLHDRVLDRVGRLIIRKG